MNRKIVYWIIGISLVLFLFCAATLTLGFLISGGLSNGLALGDAVALIKVEGIIQSGDPPTDLFGTPQTGAYSAKIVSQLKQANDDSNVKTIVLRVDSPGGGVVASDEIYEQILALDKPVLISMGTLAASGGYYISAPADEIWANRHTLTGSIGVIIQFVNLEELFEEYGVEATVLKSGVNKDTGSLFRAMTPEEQAIWQTIIDESYDTFVNIIATGRDLDQEAVRDLADGRVYTGQQALELGLIDNLGNLDDVIDRAAELGGIEGKPRIIRYDQSPSLFGGTMGQLKQPSPVEQLKQLLHLNTGPIPMYLYIGE